ncbi:DMT family transporter [Roseinatronobacter sp.]
MAAPVAKTVLLTTLAMMAFAANSVLNRIALAEGAADALTYTGVRLASGAVMLVVILAWRGGFPRLGRIGGSIGGATALFVYALAFSFAYLELAAGTGALLLFATVQLGMLGWAIKNGDRPGRFEWGGFAVAALFLVLLLLPGLSAPAPLGAALMIVAGLAWAVYTLLGRSSVRPLVDTGGNFLRCLPLAALLILPGLVTQSTSLAGWVYAIASGALASGVGYAIWYSVLPALERSTAAYVQLSVPAIAALGGVVFIAEPLTLRLVLCSAGILGGVGLAVWGADQRKRKASRAAPVFGAPKNG